MKHVSYCCLRLNIDPNSNVHELKTIDVVRVKLIYNNVVKKKESEKEKEKEREKEREFHSLT